MLRDLLAPDELGKRIWRASELGAVLHHQLAAPIEFDFSLGGIEAEVDAAQAQEIRSFGDLLHHDSPPLSLLTLAKDFAKRRLANPESPMPREIAGVLYFACIAAALVRHRRRITSLGDARLRKGLGWTADQPWVDADTRSMVLEGIKALT